MDLGQRASGVLVLALLLQQAAQTRGRSELDPSTHGVAGAASAAVLARFFGTDQVIFSMTSGPPGAGITRSFTSFSQASEESADAGVFAGIHFRTSCEAGIKQGEQIGRRAFAQNLVRYRRDPDAACRVTMGQPCEDRKAAGSAK